MGFFFFMQRKYCGLSKTTVSKSQFLEAGKQPFVKKKLQYYKKTVVF